MTKAIDRAATTKPSEKVSTSRQLHSLRQYEEIECSPRVAALDDLPDVCLIQAYLKDSKGLHVRRTLDQSHYSMLPSTEDRDVDQILIKHGKDKTSPKVVMVDQLWLWMFEGMFRVDDRCHRHLVILLRDIGLLITSFPQTWNQTKNRRYDLLTNLLEYIQGPREKPFDSAEDLAITIVQKCSTIFRSDPKLLSPDAYLLEIYQEAIGAVVSII